MSTIIEIRLRTSLHAMAMAGGVLMAWFVLAAGAVVVRLSDFNGVESAVYFDHTEGGVCCH
jgi:hypothetical protein